MFTSGEASGGSLSRRKHISSRRSSRRVRLRVLEVLDFESVDLDSRLYAGNLFRYVELGFGVGRFDARKDIPDEIVRLFRILLTFANRRQHLFIAPAGFFIAQARFFGIFGPLGLCHFRLGLEVVNPAIDVCDP